MTAGCYALLLSVLVQVGDPAKDLASDDAAVRLAAVRGIAEGGHPEAEKLLLKALKDDDWEVVETAAAGLGAQGTKKALEPLVELALEGPVRGVRRTAAESLARLDAVLAGEKLAKKLSGDLAARAAEALASLAPAADGKVELGALEKATDGRDAAARPAAARALVALAGEARPKRLEELLEHEDFAVRAFALEGAAAAADPRTAELVTGLLGRDVLDDLLERRARDALRAIALSHEEARAELEAALARASATPGARSRVARALGSLAEERGGKRGLEPAAALRALEPYLGDGDARVRAAAAAALGRIASEEALERALAVAGQDSDARVRKIALGVRVRARGAKDEKTLALLLERMKDPDTRVREDAAVALGLRGLEGARAALESALADPEWGVVTCAAVSLGKIGVEADGQQNGAALIALHERSSDDWRLRGAAVTGLARLCAKEGVPTLIAALEDAEPLVARAAHRFLVSVAHQELEPKVAVWTRWWQENEQRVRLALPEAVLEARKRLEYVRSPEEVYAGMDLLVLQSRGDHIEHVLDALSIPHRLSGSGQLIADGPHPAAIFVANCTGEITPEEAERLAWFVRAGGSLFGSCWALEETIEKLQPGLVRRKETSGEVLDDVPAYACEGTGAYLEDVFPRDVRPIYHLEGAYLIDVLDPEQVEVLIDSPQCGARWGGGNLAAWFRLGHGVVLDSANHFEGQGFTTATNLGNAEERMAYAVDHLGLSYEELRTTRQERFWSRTQTAAEKVLDLSVFRLVTNFVRLERLREE